MEQRLANTWRMTVNEKKFIETVLQSGLRIDGRRPFDYRSLDIKFGKDDGSAEVRLGQTRVMAYVTAHLVQPYRDRPNDGTLSIFTEFSPIADPSFEPGRPGESAVELGRVIDRGLRESRAVDTESLCILSGKLVWAIRVDLHILDNGGNLIDAANIAALAGLLTSWRPECSLGGENGQEVIIHPPDEREPLHLIIHHLPIAVTFGFFSYESSLVIDPTHHEEAVIRGRMTATLNSNGDVCAIQKAGGEGVLQGTIMQCLRIAAAKAGAISDMIKKEVDSHNTQGALLKIKRHSSSVPMYVDRGASNIGLKQNSSVDQMRIDECSGHVVDRIKQVPEEGIANESGDVVNETILSEKTKTNSRNEGTKNFIGGPSSCSLHLKRITENLFNHPLSLKKKCITLFETQRDPYSKGVDSDSLKASLASQGMPMLVEKQNDSKGEDTTIEPQPGDVSEDNNPRTSSLREAESAERAHGEKTLQDAVKTKNRKSKKKSRSSSGPS